MHRALSGSLTNSPVVSCGGPRIHYITVACIGDSLCLLKPSLIVRRHGQWGEVGVCVDQEGGNLTGRVVGRFGVLFPSSLIADR